MEDITVNELKRKIEAGEDFILIDVREPYEHEEFNIGGRLIPLTSIPAAIEEMKDEKDKEIVLYCRSGNRSLQAKMFMKQMGFKQVRNTLGGLVDWVEEFGMGE
ncbi:MAG TPA: rhodanese-like domain-containing protein [Saprospiraceae bacterium]|nr:rhodanese-like domain-containing protein [Saprospiraceae bacterium]